MYLKRDKKRQPLTRGRFHLGCIAKTKILLTWYHIVGG